MSVVIGSMISMTFIFCAWLVYQGIVQEDPAAGLVGAVGCFVFGTILHIESKDDPIGFIIALVTACVLCIMAYIIAIYMIQCG